MRKGNQHKKVSQNKKGKKTIGKRNRNVGTRNVGTRNVGTKKARTRKARKKIKGGLLKYLVIWFHLCMVDPLFLFMFLCFLC